jgi:L-lactate dehydrogenase complex protein LldG
VHVSLLPASSLFGSMDEALASLCADPPRNITFVTGPSRSADIEQTFTAGVLGPGKTIVVVV